MSDHKAGSDRRRLVIHVGPPKTATTYLQRILHQNRAALRDEGWSYPSVRENQQHALYGILGGKIPWVTDGVQRHYGNIGAELIDEVRRRETDLILSSEALSTLSIDGIRQLVGIIGTPDTVIFTLRDMMRIVPSAWQQYLKSGGVLDLEGFIDDLRTTRLPEEEVRGHWQTYSFGESVRRWSVASNSSINIVALPRQPQSEDDTWDLFRRAACLPDVQNKIVEKSSVNYSLSAELCECLRRFNQQLNLDNNVRKRIRRRRNFLEKCIFPTSNMELGTRIVLSPLQISLLEQWNDAEVDKAITYSSSVYGNSTDLRSRSRHLARS